MYSVSCNRLQIQLMTVLAKLEEVEGTAVRDTYRLLVDDAAPIRHAAADLVADLLPELGTRQQVSWHPASHRRSHVDESGGLTS